MSQLDQDTIQELLDSPITRSSDFVRKELHHNGAAIVLLYLRSICDDAKIQQDIVLPFYRADHIGSFQDYLRSLDSQKSSKGSSLSERIIKGEALVLSGDEVFSFAIKKTVQETVGPADVEISVVGPKQAFSEEMDININILRSRYTEPSLTFERGKLESYPKTEYSIVYDRKVVDHAVLDKIKKDLEQLRRKLVVQAAGQLARRISNVKHTLFPTVMITERPDRVVLNLSQGKVAVFVHGTPFAIVAPAVFYDFMSAMDDLYTHYWTGHFLLVLRYIGLFLNLTLASFYVGLTSYNPEFLRVQLALSIAGSRAPVPYPSYIEVVFMLLMMELLTEASIRLPRTIGSTATTVGGLILGTAATEAGLVSNIMIIIVACVAISNFVLPINEMMFAMRVMKYVFLLITTLFGVMGLVIAFIGLLVHFTRKESYGRPYLRLFKENRKVLIR
ncbi:spore germination protein [Cohnella lubricantis]|uniref:Spore germination protein n=1 Tax=Cohnella lubricantis TaxID=2163172 RepID=A0A841T9T9_9BACL|nr:spore germination protein [Cohnella lubricantis]MBB6678074.1 spore germination protein [Cohnella lubricantis]MBP2120052.1 spore germination protein [Cohnella lubricantis]